MPDNVVGSHAPVCNMSSFHLATLATAECAHELALLHESVRAFHPPESVPLVVGCSTELMAAVEADESLRGLRDDAAIHWVPCLDQYKAIDRAAMEAQPGVWYPTRHCDFMMEKANVMELALQKMELGATASARTSPTSLPPGVLYVDSDIVFLESLESMFVRPVGTTEETPIIAGVSPHYILPRDEALFGKYNGGVLFASHPVVLWHWRRATQVSRYFDQASIEDVVEAVEASEGAAAVRRFGPHVNYGFWRLFQQERGVADEVSRFSINGTSGIVYAGSPLHSVHTHWCMKTRCREIPVFNELVRGWIRRAQSLNPGLYPGLRRIAAL